MEINPAFAPRIAYLNPLLIGPVSAWPAWLDRAAALGFDHVLSAPPFRPGRAGNILVSADHKQVHPVFETERASLDVLAELAGLAHERGLTLLLDLMLEAIAADGELYHKHSHWFHPFDTAQARLDPRRAPSESEIAFANFANPDAAGHLTEWWSALLMTLADAGIGGFRCLAPHGVPTHVWRRLAGTIRERHPDVRTLAWTPGLSRDEVASLADGGFSAVFSSLRWWDYRSAWLIEEYATLARIAPPIAFPEEPLGPRLCHDFPGGDPILVERAYRRAYDSCIALGTGILMPLGFEAGAALPMPTSGSAATRQEHLGQQPRFDLSEHIVQANTRQQNTPALHTCGELAALSGPGTDVAALLRSTEPDTRTAAQAVLVTINADLAQSATATPDRFLVDVPSGFTRYVPIDEPAAEAPPHLPWFMLAPAEVRAFLGKRDAPIISAPAVKRGAKTAERKRVLEATAAPRVIIEHVQPAVDDGRFAVKRVVGDRLRVSADIFMDGHDTLAGVVLWRAADQTEWQETPLEFTGNDHWVARVPLVRLGRFEFTIEAWRDAYATLIEHAEKKLHAEQPIDVELEEARVLIHEAVEYAANSDRADKLLVQELRTLASNFDKANPARRKELTFAASTAHALAASRLRPFVVRHPKILRVETERSAARFASWYELFPRSMSNDPNRHGTFIDVIDRLPAIRDMGFDVLYFPPIHPIGRVNRKGKNNTLKALPGDVGSPYAIGAEEGGHSALHPELGSFDDFKSLLEAARAHGLELALDFAIQCAPDHPWLKEHPSWFAWRPDGTLRYAENPPKKYQDIVNPDFYAVDAVPALWLALRDVLSFWIDAGVRIFRVDNPHTKPLPFWEWVIDDIRSREPDVIFLSEAFTRPRLMYRLAKVGFSQSYSYFTWRETKKDFVDYMTELTTTEVKDFFRPNFFVNTPDINPRFLQRSGRPGFVIRAALAATFSGLWGVYSGFELCEAAALPHSEEYLDSEKYQLRQWDWHRPGNIIHEITSLNRIRRVNPALHTYHGLQFLPADNEQILFFEKATHSRDNVLVIAITLDPHAVQEAHVELPLWRFGLPDDATLNVEDQMSGTHFNWTGKYQQIRLDPHAMPFAIWRIRPPGWAGRAEDSRS
ncbi:maltotransferase domain-containing protein [Pararobbsia alpina]|uniref:Alpha-1,4-glucan:maltose-1-phosphate maltosyltransferase n=1 Tax=Pararobbsia alpina TaxID=621374 RepID=A0A6S7BED7_9BURK|nr:maltotransferase domain-containing protein [Pararobbsia alpina]CAB3786030.1 Alpha-1,4-glucan:maltose-1-phosphate maltosyltransferase [Pararobbsia alpina]